MRQADEKTRLIQDIRRHLPFVAMGHPALAEEIGRAMNMVEGRTSRPPLFAADQTRLAVGVEVEAPAYLDGTPRYGLIVQMGDEDDHAGRVLIYEGPHSEYPGWWNADYVHPLREPSREPGEEG